MLWLEPWADEVAVPGRSTVTLRIENSAPRDEGLDVEDGDEHLVVWAAGGDPGNVPGSGQTSLQGSIPAVIQLAETSPNLYLVVRSVLDH